VTGLTNRLGQHISGPPLGNPFGAKPQFIGVNYLEMGINHAPSA
jgi:hypothetical protein